MDLADKIFHLQDECAAAPTFGVNAKLLILQAAELAASEDCGDSVAPNLPPVRHVRAPAPPPPPPPPAHLWTGTELFALVPARKRPLVEYDPRSSIPRLTRQGIADRLFGEYLLWLLEHLKVTRENGLEVLMKDEAVWKSACGAANSHERDLFYKAHSKGAYISSGSVAAVAPKQYMKQEEVAALRSQYAPGVEDTPDEEPDAGTQKDGQHSTGASTPPISDLFASDSDDDMDIDENGTARTPSPPPDFPPGVSPPRQDNTDDPTGDIAGSTADHEPHNYIASPAPGDEIPLGFEVDGNDVPQAPPPPPPPPPPPLDSYRAAENAVDGAALDKGAGDTGAGRITDEKDEAHAPSSHLPTADGAKERAEHASHHSGSPLHNGDKGGEGLPERNPQPRSPKRAREQVSPARHGSESPSREGRNKRVTGREEDVGERPSKRSRDDAYVRREGDQRLQDRRAHGDRDNRHSSREGNRGDRHDRDWRKDRHDGSSRPPPRSSHPDSPHAQKRRRSSRSRSPDRRSPRSHHSRSFKDHSTDNRTDRNRRQFPERDKSVEHRSDKAGENRNDRHGDNRGDKPGDDRGGDNRGDRPGENRGDRPGDNRGHRLGENRGDRPGETRGERARDNRSDRPGDSRSDRQGSNKGDRKSGSPAHASPSADAKMTISPATAVGSEGDKSTKEAWQPSHGSPGDKQVDLVANGLRHSKGSSHDSSRRSSEQKKRSEVSDDDKISLDDHGSSGRGEARKSSYSRERGGEDEKDRKDEAHDSHVGSGAEANGVKNMDGGERGEGKGVHLGKLGNAEREKQGDRDREKEGEKHGANHREKEREKHGVEEEQQGHGFGLKHEGHGNRRLDSRKREGESDKGEAHDEKTDRVRDHRKREGEREGSGEGRRDKDKASRRHREKGAEGRDAGRNEHRGERHGEGDERKAKGRESKREAEATTGTGRSTPDAVPPPPGGRSDDEPGDAKRLVREHLKLFVRTALDPFYRNKEITREEYTNVAKRCVDKVASAHPHEDSADFLLREAPQIRKLVKSMVKHVQQKRASD